MRARWFSPRRPRMARVARQSTRCAPPREARIAAAKRTRAVATPAAKKARTAGQGSTNKRQGGSPQL
eukprot:4095649-Alexandrium_andersonii.AAC.1